MPNIVKALRLISVLVLTLLLFSTASKGTLQDTWWDPDGIGSGEDWTYRLPVTLTKAGGYEGSRYSRHFTDVTVDFAAKGFDNINQNSLRLVRYNGTSWVEVPIDVKAWTDQDSDSQMDRAQFWFAIDPNDLLDSSQTTVTYYLYFDIVSNGTKTAKSYTTLSNLRILCLDTDIESQVCEELSNSTYATIDKLSVTSSTATGISDLAIDNLENYDILFLGWNAVSNDSTYRLSGYETDIKSFVQNGGSVISAATDNSGFQTGWLPDPGSMYIVDYGSVSVNTISPYNTEIFNTPNANALSGTTQDEYYTNVNGSGWIVMGQYNTTIRNFLRKNYGIGVYLLSTIDARTTTLAAAARSYFKNAIYWSWRYQTQNIGVSAGSAETYTADALAIYASDYSTALTTARMGDMMYIQINGDDINSGTAGTMPVTVTSTTDQTGISINLTETSATSGVYRGTATLYNSSDAANRRINTDVGETVTVKTITKSEKTDSLTVEAASPTTITSLDLKSNSTYANSLTETVEIGATLFIQVDAPDANSMSTDRTTALITSTSDATGIYVTLTETGRNTGIFRGTAIVAASSNDALDYIGAGNADTITVRSVTDTAKYDTCPVKSTPPTAVTSVKLYQSNYSTELTSATGGTTFYIELVGTDGNSYYADKTTVNVKSSVTDTTGIGVQISETGPHTGIYRGSATLYASSDIVSSRIGAQQIGETVTVTSDDDPTKTDTLTVSNTAPTTIASVILKSDSSYATDLSTSLKVGNTLYIQLSATDLNPLTRDTSVVNVKSSTTDTTGISVTLTESAPSSGIFRGTAVIKAASNDASDEIGANVSETVTITSSTDAAKTDTVLIESSSPNSITSLYFMDSAYSAALGSSITVAVGQYLYIEVVATDINALSKDTTTIKVTSTSDPTGITVLLTESGNNTGRFRGIAVVAADSNDTTDEIKGQNGNVITAASTVDISKTDTINVVGTPPKGIFSLNIYQSDYSTALTQVKGGSTLYIEARGVDGSTSTTDRCTVTITSTSDPVGISVTLTEQSSGTERNRPYRGTAVVRNASSQASGYIMAAKGDTINVLSNDAVYVVDGSGDFWFEGEGASRITPSMTIDSGSGTSGGQYIHVPQGLQSGAAEFVVYKAATGNTRYYLYGRLYPVDSDGNTFYRQMDGGTQSTWSAGTSYGNWNTSWSYGNYYTLSQGAHVLRISNNAEANDAVRLDKAALRTVRTAPTTYGNSPIISYSSDTVLVVNTAPSAVSAVTLKSDSTYATNLSKNLELNNILYIQLQGTDGDAYIANTTTATVKSSITDTTGITVTLTETGINTGIYRGTAAIKTTSSQSASEIGAAASETITVRSSVDTTKYITVGVSTAANLSIGTVTTVPTQVTKGQSGISVSFNVSNLGSAPANVTAAGLTFTNSGDFTVTASPSNPTQVAGLQTATFTFTVDVKTSAATGTNTINATITAYDIFTDASAGDTSASVTDSWTVSQPGALSSSMTALPANVSYGQQYTVTMTVSNTGGNTVNTVAPSALTLSGTAGATLVSGPTPASAVINPSAQQQFTWTYTSSSSGLARFTGTASGVESVSGATVTSSSATTNDVSVSSPASLSATLTGTPSSVVLGQQFTVKMRVTNSGQTAANAVTPTSLTVGGSSSATLVSGPSPASASVAGGAYQDFTWTYQAGSVEGTVDFTGSASGSDANSGVATNTGSVTSNSVTLTRGAEISAVISGPTYVSTTQTFAVTMVVTNTGGTAASNVTPGTLTIGGTSTASRVSGPTPANSTIAAGASQTFTWNYVAGTNAGTLNFSGLANGSDASTGGAVTTSTATSVNTTVRLKAELATNFSIFPTVVSTGQTFTVRIRVVNTGQAAALNVTPAAITVTGAAQPTLLTGPTPASIASLAGGSSTNFTWTYNAGSTPGTFTFSTYATGTDIYASTPVDFSTATSPMAEVQTAGALVSSISINKQFISSGQQFTVTMDASNTGGVNLVNVRQSLTRVGVAATLVSGPTPATATIAPGGTQTFTWVYTAGGTGGNIYFSGYAYGTDANSGLTAYATTTVSGTSVVQTPAALTSVMNVTPSVVGVSDAITVTMNVTNTGQATATTAAPSALTLGGTGAALRTSGPTPASANLSAGASQTFTWIYSASSVGTVNFTGNASAIDSNTGQTATSTVSTSSNVTISSTPDAAIAAGIVASPSTVSPGAPITVVMTVQNGGSATASNVIPTALTTSGSGAASLTSGPSPSSATIPGGQYATFTWTYNPTSDGTIAFTGSASGTNGGVPPPDTVSTSNTTSNQVIIQSAAALSAAISVPQSRNTGQSMTVTMTVSNTGGATTNNVSPSALTIGGTGSATPVSGPTPASASIAGGAQQQFTWTYTAGPTASTVNFTGSAAGTDANSGAAVNAAATTSANCAIQTAAAITGAITSPSYTLSLNQLVNITYTVSNSGGETANNVTPPLTLPYINGQRLTKTSGPTPLSANIPGGSQQQFVYSYRATTTGNTNLQSAATGTANNSAVSVTTGTNQSSTITVVNAAALSTTMTASPAVLNTGQTITVLMKVRNTGGAPALNVTPSSLTLAGGAGATRLTGPVPASATIANGASQTFTWTYSATTAGTLNFTGDASGADKYSSSTITSNSEVSNNVTITAPAALSAAITTSPSGNAGFNQQVTVTMTVTNTGGAAANNVAPSSLTLGGTSSGTTFGSGPSPVSQTLAAGASTTFSWTYTTGTSTGTLNFSGNASGTDANSLQTVSSAATTSANIIINAPAALTITLAAQPSNPQPGAAITILATVKNTGSTSAINVVPSVLTLGGTATANYSSGPTPSGNTIPPGLTKNYSWSYIAGTTFGTVNFTGNASGVDNYTGQTVSSSITTSNSVNITSLTPIWVYPPTGTIGAVRSSASVRKSTVYIGSDDDYLYALNSSNGSLKWSRLTTGNVVSTPFPIDDGSDYWTVYFGTHGNYVYAVTEDNTKAAGWAAVGINIGNSIVSTTVSDGVNIYFGCYDKKVYAVNITNGSITWVSQTLNGTLVSSPAVGTAELYIGSTDGKLYSLNIADGTYLRDFSTGGSVEGSPWVDYDGKIYIGSSSGKFYKLNASNLSQVWVYPSSGSVGAIISSPWVEHPLGAVYFGSDDGKLYAVDVNTGQLKTGYTPCQTGAAIKSSPLIWKNIAYFGSNDGKFYAINALTGALLSGWPYETGDMVLSSPSLEYIDGVNDRVFIGSNIGKIFCFEAK